MKKYVIVYVQLNIVDEKIERRLQSNNNLHKTDCTHLMVLYDKKMTCLNCDEEFRSKAVKIRSIRPGKTDGDGRIYYDGKANPYLYQILGCPHCGFIFSQSFYINRKDKKLIQEGFLDKLSFIEDYSGERTIEEAIKIWKLGLVSAQVSKQKTESLSGIALRIAWLYRYLDDQREMVFLKMAMEGYKNAYKNEDLMNNEVDVVKIIFYASIKLKEVDEARVWLNELYKFRQSDLIVDAKEQFDKLRKSIPEESN